MMARFHLVIIHTGKVKNKIPDPQLISYFLDKPAYSVNHLPLLCRLKTAKNALNTQGVFYH